MADKTIWGLSSFEEVSRGASDKIQEDDLLIISKHMTPDTSDFITVKLRADELSSSLYDDFYPKLKDTLSSSNDYDLKALAHLDTLPGSLIDDGTISLTEKVKGYKGLALSDEADLRLSCLASIYKNQYSTDLGLSDLAHVSKIGLSNSSWLSGKLPLVSIDCEFGDLILSSCQDLNLRALAHRDSITESHLVGTLDFPTKIRNFRPALDKLYKLSAASSTLGGIRTGFSADSRRKNYAVELSNETAYVHVPWTDTVYTLPAASPSALGGVKTGFSQHGNLYAVNIDLSGNAYVNVPWRNTTYSSGPGITVTETKALSLDIATRTTLGGIKTGFFEPLQNVAQNYAVQLSGERAYVHVPWTDTKFVLDRPTADKFGGIKLGKTSGKKYAVFLDPDGTAYVNVPWQNTDTTYTAGPGIKITGTTISLADPTPAPQIKYSGIGTASASIQVSGTVYSKSSRTKAVSYNGKTYTMNYDTWTAGNDCIVTVYVSLPMDISSCGTPCKREIYFQPAGGAMTSIYELTKKTTGVIPLVLKAGDTIQITGACSTIHGTTYQIIGTYLNRS